MQKKGYESAYFARDGLNGLKETSGQGRTQGHSGPGKATTKSRCDCDVWSPRRKISEQAIDVWSPHRQKDVIVICRALAARKVSSTLTLGSQLYPHGLPIIPNTAFAYVSLDIMYFDFTAPGFSR